MPFPGEIFNDVYDATNHVLKVSGGGGGGGGVSAVYNVTPPTYTNGASATLQTDVNGTLKTVVYDAPAATTVNLTTLDAASATTSTGFNGAIVVTGTPTAGSTNAITFNGENAIAIQLSGTWVGTVSFERTIDGTTWHPATIISGGNPYTYATGNGLFFINAAGALGARARLSAYTSGTVASSLYAATGIFPISVVNAQLGQYNLTPPTVTSGMNNAVQIDVNGNQKSNMATRLDAVNDAVTAYPFGHSFVNLATSTTTTAKTGSGVLKGLIIGDPGATWQVVLYDNTAASGTIIATIKFTSTTSSFIDFEAAFTTGLTAITSGTTAGNITLVYR